MRASNAYKQRLSEGQRYVKYIIPSRANVSYPLLAASKVQQSSHSNFVRGALYGLSAVSIWAAFIVVSRLGVRTSLTPWDVAAIRFGTAGVLLLPYLVKKGLALDRLGWIGLVAISIGCGAPMVLLVNAGLLFAPAAHGGALFPGVMPLIVAMLAAIILKEAATPQKNVGLVLIVLGAVMIVWATGGTLGTPGGLVSRFAGHRQVVGSGGRGGDGDYSPPPAQIPAGAANAPGSRLGW
jgi:drug/metabolite transporter (DMT)-like permease